MIYMFYTVKKETLLTMKVKICGINDAVFAAEAVRLGVDYLGFIFEPSSPRFVTPEKARSICSSLEQRHKALDSSASSARRPLK